MSHSIAPLVSFPGLTFILTEQAICDRCESTIPQSHVMANMDTQDMVPTQTVNAHCPHCDAVYVCQRQLRGGIWQILGGVTYVTNGHISRRIINRIAKRNGDRQQQPRVLKEAPALPAGFADQDPDGLS